MARTTCFVKVSGDAFRNPAFLAWAAELSKDRYVVVCVGGGTQINEELEKEGVPFKPHGPLGRELETFAHRQLARNILELNAVGCEDILAAQGIHVHVTIPVLDVGGVLCHVNGDQMVRTVYLGYRELYVITCPEREADKTKEFASLPKVHVLSF